MIVFDLECQSGKHRFEGWFGSSEEFAQQQRRGLVTCPHCGSVHVIKAPMAPRVPRKGNQLEPKSNRPMPLANTALPQEAGKMMEKLAAMQADVLKESRWVGDGFADQSRAMHYGERAPETIHGQATLAEAKELLEEGVAVMPLPFPVAPPDSLN